MLTLNRVFHRLNGHSLQWRRVFHMKAQLADQLSAVILNNIA
jgi:hypothetical protein